MINMINETTNLTPNKDKEVIAQESMNERKTLKTLMVNIELKKTELFLLKKGCKYDRYKI